eukprot:scaffold31714_cov148-Skeletonema_menzelii.AAC.4
MSMLRSKLIQVKVEPPPSPHSQEVQVEEKRKAFTDYARKSNLPSLDDWSRDSLLVPSIRGNNITYSSPSGLNSCSSLPTDGSVVQIKSSLFEGKLVTRLRDADKASDVCNNYFRNRSRQYNWIVQGTFIQRTRFDDVITGQEFGRPFRNKPSSQIVQRLLDMLKHKLPESFECDFLAEKPFFRHPLIAGCQHFRIDKVTDFSAEDELHGISTDGNVIEDTCLLNDAKIPQDGAGRRKFFSKNSNLSRFYFEPDLMYTFDFYSDFFSPTKFSLEMAPLLSIDIMRYFNGYPLFLSMAKDKSKGEYLWATEIWHKRLLNYEETPGRLARWCW